MPISPIRIPISLIRWIRHRPSTINTNATIIIPTAIPPARPVAVLHGHLILRPVRRITLRPHTGQQIQHKAKHIAGKDKRDDPLENRSGIITVPKRKDAKRDRECNFHQDENQLRPKRHAQKAVLPIVDPQSLVLGADQDRAEDVAGDEEEQEAIVHVGVAVRIEDGEEDQADRPGDGEEDAGDAEEYLVARGVAGEAAGVAQVALREEGEVEEYGGYDSAGDEEWFEGEGTHVGDVGYGLAVVHGGVDAVVPDEPGY